MVSISRAQNRIYSSLCDQAYVANSTSNLKLTDEEAKNIFKNVMTAENIKTMETGLKKSPLVKNYTGKEPLIAIYNLKKVKEEYYFTAEVYPPGANRSSTIALCRIGRDKDGKLNNILYPISLDAADEKATPLAEKEISEKKLSGDKAEEIRKKYKLEMKNMMEAIAQSVSWAEPLVPYVKKEISN